MKKGFSLIEVLLVLGITSVLLVVGVTSMLGYLGSQNLESEAKSLVAVMRDAQSKSMGQDEESRWGVYLQNNTGSERDSFTLFQANETLVASSTYIGIPGTALEQKTMRSNVEFAAPAEGTSTIVLFSKIGGLPNMATEIILERVDDPTSQKTITVSGNGKIDYQ